MLHRRFFLAGRAVFTVRHGDRELTFRVSKGKKKGDLPQAWFAELLPYPHNLKERAYIGVVDPETGAVRLTANSRFRDSYAARLEARKKGLVKPTDPPNPAEVVIWVLKKAWAGQDLPAGYELAVDRCAKCRKPLTDPDSQKDGLGRDCLKKILEQEAAEEAARREA